jgi:molecular chaperone HscC
MIGIDLGTTNSLVATMDCGVPRTLVNEAGEDLVPSAVAVAEDGELLVGRAAKDRLVVAPDSGRSFFKREMGTSASYTFGGKRWTPVECSAIVLRELKRVAELRLGKCVDSAVITVPAYFHNHQRQATLDAAEIAGLRVERLVNEPTAAALAYGFRPDSSLSTLLVFDLGGGTFDVTVLECFEGVMEVKASAGESMLGGEDYTDALAAWVMNKFHWTPPAPDKLRWREQIETLKRRLSKEEHAYLSLGNEEVLIPRADFLSATAELSLRLRPVVRRALRDANLAAQYLDAVLLVGGASRMPIVFEQLKEDLRILPDTSVDPDRVVALGAAVQQALCTGHEAVSDLVLTDVCPHTLGVEVSKEIARNSRESGYFSPIIDRNTTVPVSRSQVYSTVVPDQDSILLSVYQGERRLVKENHRIGEIRIRGLRHRPEQSDPGKIEVRFTYDMNGLLEVEVTVLHSGKKLTEVFQQRPGTLTQEQIDEAIRALRRLKVHPRESPPNRARLERANRLYADLVGDLRDRLTGLTDRFESALAAQDEDRIRISGASLDAFMAQFFKDG